MAYRASALIWITTDLVPALTMPLMWAKADHSGPIAGYTSGDFVLYYLCLLFLGNFISSHIMWDLAMEIKEGQFSTQLVRPISYYQICFFRNLSWRVLRMILFAPMFVGLLAIYSSYITHTTLYLGWEFWVSLILGHLVSFTTVMMMAMLALFFQEVTSIFELYYVPTLFLSGRLFPIAVLPAWAQSLAKLLPFYYTTGAPTEILIGRVTGPQILSTVGAQLIWVGLAYGASKVLWKFGLKHYTGVGM